MRSALQVLTCLRAQRWCWAAVLAVTIAQGSGTQRCSLPCTALLQGSFSFKSKRDLRQIALCFPITHSMLRVHSLYPLPVGFLQPSDQFFHEPLNTSEEKPKQNSEKIGLGKKKIFEGTYFIVSIFRGITLNVYPVPFPLIFILEQLRRQKGRAYWHQSVSLEVRQEHMKALADNAK